MAFGKPNVDLIRMIDENRHACPYPANNNDFENNAIPLTVC